MLTGQFSQGRYRGDITIHAEHTVGHDHFTSSVVFIQTTTEMIHIVVLIALTASTAQLAGIEQRGMVQTILKHGVLFAQQSTDDAEVGHVTIGKQQYPVAAGKLRQRFFQLVVRPTVANHQV